MKQTLCALLLALTALPATATNWTVQADSRLWFTATQSGAEFDGEFGKFDAQMRFDPDALGGSGFEVTIDVTSFDSNSRDRDGTVGKRAWFYFANFPTARFVTESIRETGPDQYTADATLTIKGNSVPVSLPFTWTIDGDRAVMDGDVTLDRRQFDVGTGEWRSGKTVGTDVTVHVDLVLTRQ